MTSLSTFDFDRMPIHMLVRSFEGHVAYLNICYKDFGHILEEKEKIENIVKQVNACCTSHSPILSIDHDLKEIKILSMQQRTPLDIIAIERLLTVYLYNGQFLSTQEPTCIVTIRER